MLFKYNTDSKRKRFPCFADDDNSSPSYEESSDEVIPVIMTPEKNDPDYEEI